MTHPTHDRRPEPPTVPPGGLSRSARLALRERILRWYEAAPHTPDRLSTALTLLHDLEGPDTSLEPWRRFPRNF
ncbi:hypothetical protein [Deinococcus pimensis]|uniref:hypothetical protein n=1 Tax=Deinococcus pimensis TaxID=309888 RepID=UPI0012FB4369|nr:hypothetical protein [Deinococcus pimensis]